jgi:hypothetical protein
MIIRWYRVVCSMFVGKDSDFVNIYSDEKYEEAMAYGSLLLLLHVITINGAQAPYSRQYGQNSVRPPHDLSLTRRSWGEIGSSGAGPQYMRR